MEERIKKIKRYQLIEYYRHRRFYETLESYKNGDELKWIHSMACYYLVEIAERDEKEIIKLISVIQDFEKEVEWYYEKGISDEIEHIKDILADQFISYSEMIKDDEEEQEIWDEMEYKISRYEDYKNILSLFKSKL